MFYLLSIYSKIYKIIPKYNNVVNYDEKGNKTTIFDKIHSLTPTVTKDLTDIFDLLSSEDISNWTNTDLVNFVDGMQSADDNLKNFLKDWDKTGDVAEAYQQYMQKAGNATSKFGLALKNVTANVGIMLAITAAVKLASVVWDKFDTTVAEAKEDLDETIYSTAPVLRSVYYRIS